MDLANYSPNHFSRGRSSLTEAIWIICRTFAFSNLVPFSKIRVLLLRLFGASIGRGVIIKPGVKIKFPWRLTIGNHVWLGEDAWIDNLALVTIGDNTCISQGAYLCTGSHDWKSNGFDLITKPISIGSKVWIAAGATIAPGITIGDGAVVSLGCIVTSDVEPWMVLSQAQVLNIKPRAIRQS